MVDWTAAWMACLSVDPWEDSRAGKKVEWTVDQMGSSVGWTVGP